MRIETAILKNLLQNEDYTRKVLPFLKTDYFTENADKTVYNKIHDFVVKYNNLPSKEAAALHGPFLVGCAVRPSADTAWQSGPPGASRP